MENHGISLAEARDNFNALNLNPYPGRGIIVGLNNTGEYLVQVYWIMGRSPDSRNRLFDFDEYGRLFTKPADPKKMRDASLIIYNAMAERDGSCYVVSNGHQTNAVADLYILGALRSILIPWTYEPDAPNYTPRITAVTYRPQVGNQPTVEMSMIRRSRWSDESDRFHFSTNSLAPGFGFCLTTYSGDGSPLPSFRGEPLLMPLMGDFDSVGPAIWGRLNEENRVSLAVKFISRENGFSRISIINKYTAVNDSAVS